MVREGRGGLGRDMQRATLTYDMHMCESCAFSRAHPSICLHVNVKCMYVRLEFARVRTGSKNHPTISERLHEATTSVRQMNYLCFVKLMEE